MHTELHDHYSCFFPWPALALAQADDACVCEECADAPDYHSPQIPWSISVSFLFWTLEISGGPQP